MGNSCCVTHSAVIIVGPNSNNDDCNHNDDSSNIDGVDASEKESLPRQREQEQQESRDLNQTNLATLVGSPLTASPPKFPSNRSATASSSSSSPRLRRIEQQQTRDQQNKTNTTLRRSAGADSSIASLFMAATPMGSGGRDEGEEGIGKGVGVREDSTTSFVTAATMMAAPPSSLTIPTIISVGGLFLTADDNNYNASATDGGIRRQQQPPHPHPHSRSPSSSASPSSKGQSTSHLLGLPSNFPPPPISSSSSAANNNNAGTILLVGASSSPLCSHHQPRPPSSSACYSSRRHSSAAASPSVNRSRAHSSIGGGGCDANGGNTVGKSGGNYDDNDDVLRTITITHQVAPSPSPSPSSQQAEDHQEQQQLQDDNRQKPPPRSSDGGIGFKSVLTLFSPSVTMNAKSDGGGTSSSLLPPPFSSKSNRNPLVGAGCTTTTSNNDEKREEKEVKITLGAMVLSNESAATGKNLFTTIPQQQQQHHQIVPASHHLLTVPTTGGGSGNNGGGLSSLNPLSGVVGTSSCIPPVQQHHQSFGMSLGNFGATMLTEYDGGDDDDGDDETNKNNKSRRSSLSSSDGAGGGGNSEPRSSLNDPSHKRYNVLTVNNTIAANNDRSHDISNRDVDVTAAAFSPQQPHVISPLIPFARPAAANITTTATKMTPTTDVAVVATSSEEPQQLQMSIMRLGGNTPSLTALNPPPPPPPYPRPPQTPPPTDTSNSDGHKMVMVTNPRNTIMDRKSGANDEGKCHQTVVELSQLSATAAIVLNRNHTDDLKKKTKESDMTCADRTKKNEGDKERRRRADAALLFHRQSQRPRLPMNNCESAAAAPPSSIPLTPPPSDNNNKSAANTKNSKHFLVADALRIEQTNFTRGGVNPFVPLRMTEMVSSHPFLLSDEVGGSLGNGDHHQLGIGIGGSPSVPASAVVTPRSNTNNNCARNQLLAASNSNKHFRFAQTMNHSSPSSTAASIPSPSSATSIHHSNQYYNRQQQRAFSLFSAASGGPKTNLSSPDTDDSSVPPSAGIKNNFTSSDASSSSAALSNLVLEFAQHLQADHKIDAVTLSHLPSTDAIVKTVINSAAFAELHRKIQNEIVKRQQQQRRVNKKTDEQGGAGDVTTSIADNAINFNAHHKNTEKTADERHSGAITLLKSAHPLATPQYDDHHRQQQRLSSSSSAGPSPLGVCGGEIEVGRSKPPSQRSTTRNPNAANDYQQHKNHGDDDECHDDFGSSSIAPHSISGGGGGHFCDESGDGCGDHGVNSSSATQGDGGAHQQHPHQVGSGLAVNSDSASAIPSSRRGTQPTSHSTTANTTTSPTTDDNSNKDAVPISIAEVVSSNAAFPSSDAFASRSGVSVASGGARRPSAGPHDRAIISKKNFANANTTFHVTSGGGNRKNGHSPTATTPSTVKGFPPMSPTSTQQPQPLEDHNVVDPADDGDAQPPPPNCDGGEFDFFASLSQYRQSMNQQSNRRVVAASRRRSNIGSEGSDGISFFAVPPSYDVDAHDENAGGNMNDNDNDARDDGNTNVSPRHRVPGSVQSVASKVGNNNSQNNNNNNNNNPPSVRSGATADVLKVLSVFAEARKRSESDGNAALIEFLGGTIGDDEERSHSPRPITNTASHVLHSNELQTAPITITADAVDDNHNPECGGPDDDHDNVAGAAPLPPLPAVVAAEGSILVPVINEHHDYIGGGSSKNITTSNNNNNNNQRRVDDNTPLPTAEGSSPHSGNSGGRNRNVHRLTNSDRQSPVAPSTVADADASSNMMNRSIGNASPASSDGSIFDVLRRALRLGVSQIGAPPHPGSSTTTVASTKGKAKMALSDENQIVGDDDDLPVHPILADIVDRKTEVSSTPSPTTPATNTTDSSSSAAASLPPPHPPTTTSSSESPPPLLPFDAHTVIDRLDEQNLMLLSLMLLQRTREEEEGGGGGSVEEWQQHLRSTSNNNNNHGVGASGAGGGHSEMNNLNVLILAPHQQQQQHPSFPQQQPHRVPPYHPFNPQQDESQRLNDDGGETSGVSHFSPRRVVTRNSNNNSNVIPTTTFLVSGGNNTLRTISSNTNRSFGAGMGVGGGVAANATSPSSAAVTLFDNNEDNEGLLVGIGYGAASTNDSSSQRSGGVDRIPLLRVGQQSALGGGGVGWLGGGASGSTSASINFHAFSGGGGGSEFSSSPQRSTAAAAAAVMTNLLSNHYLQQSFGRSYRSAGTTTQLDSITSRPFSQLSIISGIGANNSNQQHHRAASFNNSSVITMNALADSLWYASHGVIGQHFVHSLLPQFERAGGFGFDDNNTCSSFATSRRAPPSVSSGAEPPQSQQQQQMRYNALVASGGGGGVTAKSPPRVHPQQQQQQQYNHLHNNNHHRVYTRTPSTLRQQSEIGSIRGVTTTFTMHGGGDGGSLRSVRSGYNGILLGGGGGGGGNINSGNNNMFLPRGTSNATNATTTMLLSNAGSTVVGFSTPKLPEMSPLMGGIKPPRLPSQKISEGDDDERRPRGGIEGGESGVPTNNEAHASPPCSDFLQQSTAIFEPERHAGAFENGNGDNDVVYLAHGDVGGDEKECHNEEGEEQSPNNPLNRKSMPLLFSTSSSVASDMNDNSSRSGAAPTTTTNELSMIAMHIPRGESLPKPPIAPPISGEERMSSRVKNRALVGGQQSGDESLDNIALPPKSKTAMVMTSSVAHRNQHQQHNSGANYLRLLTSPLSASSASDSRHLLSPSPRNTMRSQDRLPGLCDSAILSGGGPATSYSSSSAVHLSLASECNYGGAVVAAPASSLPSPPKSSPMSPVVNKNIIPVLSHHASRSNLLPTYHVNATLMGTSSLPQQPTTGTAALPISASAPTVDIVIPPPPASVSAALPTTRDADESSRGNINDNPFNAALNATNGPTDASIYGEVMQSMLALSDTYGGGTTTTDSSSSAATGAPRTDIADAYVGADDPFGTTTTMNDTARAVNNLVVNGENNGTNNNIAVAKGSSASHSVSASRSPRDLLSLAAQQQLNNSAPSFLMNTASPRGEGGGGGDCAAVGGGVDGCGEEYSAAFVKGENGKEDGRNINDSDDLRKAMLEAQASVVRMNAEALLLSGDNESQIKPSTALDAIINALSVGSAPTSSMTAGGGAGSTGSDDNNSPSSADAMRIILLRALLQNSMTIPIPPPSHSGNSKKFPAITFQSVLSESMRLNAANRLQNEYAEAQFAEEEESVAATEQQQREWGENISKRHPTKNPQNHSQAAFVEESEAEVVYPRPVPRGTRINHIGAFVTDDDDLPCGSGSGGLNLSTSSRFAIPNGSSSSSQSKIWRRRSVNNHHHRYPSRVTTHFMRSTDEKEDTNDNDINDFIIGGGGDSGGCSIGRQHRMPFVANATTINHIRNEENNTGNYNSLMPRGPNTLNTNLHQQRVQPTTIGPAVARFMRSAQRNTSNNIHRMGFAPAAAASSPTNRRAVSPSRPQLVHGHSRSGDLVEMLGFSSATNHNASPSQSMAVSELIPDGSFAMGNIRSTVVFGSPANSALHRQHHHHHSHYSHQHSAATIEPLGGVGGSHDGSKNTVPIISPPSRLRYHRPSAVRSHEGDHDDDQYPIPAQTHSSEYGSGITGDDSSHHGRNLLFSSPSSPSSPTANKPEFVASQHEQEESRGGDQMAHKDNVNNQIPSSASVSRDFREGTFGELCVTEAGSPSPDFSPSPKRNHAVMRNVNRSVASSTAHNPSKNGADDQVVVSGGGSPDVMTDNNSPSGLHAGDHNEEGELRPLALLEIRTMMKNLSPSELLHIHRSKNRK